MDLSSTQHLELGRLICGLCAGPHENPRHGGGREAVQLHSVWRQVNNISTTFLLPGTRPSFAEGLLEGLYHEFHGYGSGFIFAVVEPHLASLLHCVVNMFPYHSWCYECRMIYSALCDCKLAKQIYPKQSLGTVLGIRIRIRISLDPSRDPAPDPSIQGCGSAFISSGAGSRSSILG